MEGGKSIFKKLKKQETSSTSSTNIYITEKEKKPRWICTDNIDGNKEVL